MGLLRTDAHVSPLFSRLDQTEKPEALRPDAESRRSFEEVLRRPLKKEKISEEEVGGWLMLWQATTGEVSFETKVASPEQETVASPTGVVLTPPAAAPVLPKPVPLEALHIRLSQGPLAGMEIHVSLESGALLLRLAVADQRRVDKLAASRARLASLLEEVLECSVTLEVKHVASTP